MRKYILAGVCIGGGILLCAFNKSAFTVLSIIIGLAAAGASGYLLWRSICQRDFPPLAAIAAAALSIALLVLSVAFRRISLILGGIIFVATGILFLVFCSQSVKLFVPFCVGCVIIGLMIIFLPLWIGILSAAAGIFLIFYGAIFAFYL